MSSDLKRDTYFDAAFNAMAELRTAAREINDATSLWATRQEYVRMRTQMVVHLLRNLESKLANLSSEVRVYGKVR